MVQPNLSDPANPLSLASILGAAEYERWMSEARALPTPGQPGFVRTLDSLRPSPLLSAVIERSFIDPGHHSDAELDALLRACERIIAHARLIRELAPSDLAGSADVA